MKEKLNLWTYSVKNVLVSTISVSQLLPSSWLVYPTHIYDGLGFSAAHVILLKASGSDHTQLGNENIKVDPSSIKILALSKNKGIVLSFTYRHLQTWKTRCFTLAANVLDHNVMVSISNVLHFEKACHCKHCRRPQFPAISSYNVLWARKLSYKWHTTCNVVLQTFPILFINDVFNLVYICHVNASSTLKKKGLRKNDSF